MAEKVLRSVLSHPGQHDQGPVAANTEARGLAEAAGVDFDEQEPEGVNMLLKIAAHTLRQE